MLQERSEAFQDAVRVGGDVAFTNVQPGNSDIRAQIVRWQALLTFLKL
jgi:hypothetical protein